MPQFAKWRPPLLPPRPVLPGDTGWDERIRHVAEPRRGLAESLRSTLEIHCDAVLLANQLNMTVEIEIYLLQHRKYICDWWIFSGFSIVYISLLEGKFSTIQ